LDDLTHVNNDQQSHFLAAFTNTSVINMFTGAERNTWQ
jgi:hypothetical protein